MQPGTELLDERDPQRPRRRPGAAPILEREALEVEVDPVVAVAHDQRHDLVDERGPRRHGRESCGHRVGSHAVGDRGEHPDARCLQLGQVGRLRRVAHLLLDARDVAGAMRGVPERRDVGEQVSVGHDRRGRGRGAPVGQPARHDATRRGCRRPESGSRERRGRQGHGHQPCRCSEGAPAERRGAHVLVPHSAPRGRVTSDVTVIVCRCGGGGSGTPMR